MAGAGDPPDAMQQELARLRAANQASVKENSRLRAEASEKEFEASQLEKTIRKLERKIEALEDAGAKRSALASGFLKPSSEAPETAAAPAAAAAAAAKKPAERKAGAIIDAATGQEVTAESYWGPEEEEETGNILLRKKAYSPEAELMREMQQPIESNPDFDVQRYSQMVSEGKEQEAEAFMKQEGGPTLEQMQRAPMEVLQKHIGLDVNWRDEAWKGCSLLQWACSMGFSDVATELLKRRADPSLKSEGGMTALASACSRNWPDCAQLLLEGRASPDDLVGGEGGQSLLMWASRVEYCDEEGREHLNPYVRMLLESRADFEQRDTRGKTALIHASTEGSAQAVMALLEARADVDAKDGEGQTAWQLALKYCHGRVSSLLLPRRNKAAAAAEGSS